ncbi:hypothetical protein MRX96_020719 [Rhipicephalus microplus]
MFTSKANRVSRGGVRDADGKAGSAAWIFAVFGRVSGGTRAKPKNVNSCSKSASFDALAGDLRTSTANRVSQGGVRNADGKVGRATRIFAVFGGVSGGTPVKPSSAYSRTKSASFDVLAGDRGTSTAHHVSRGGEREPARASAWSAFARLLSYFEKRLPPHGGMEWSTNSEDSWKKVAVKRRNSEFEWHFGRTRTWPFIRRRPGRPPRRRRRTTDALRAARTSGNVEPLPSRETAPDVLAPECILEGVCDERGLPGNYGTATTQTPRRDESLGLPPPRKKKPKRSKYDEEIERLSKFITDKPDEHERFGAFLAEEMRRVPPHLVDVMQLQLLQIVTQ